MKTTISKREKSIIFFFGEKPVKKYNVYVFKKIKINKMKLHNLKKHIDIFITHYMQHMNALGELTAFGWLIPVLGK